MIISKFFGNPHSKRNLGNQLFELVSLIGLAKRYKTSLALPQGWQYRSCFKLDSVVEFKPIESYITIQEPDFHCCLDFFDKLDYLIKNENVNIEGFLQSEKYWKNFDTDIRNSLAFTDSIKEFAYHYLNDNDINVDQFVAVSVRRGDFATDPNHYLLPLEYYTGAINRFFSTKEIIVFSDDIPWCKQHFIIPGKRIIFAEKQNAIEQLSLMSLFSNFIIANSTFSWWGAYLSKADNKKIIRPYHHFDGDLRMKFSIKDHYPQSWEVYNHTISTMQHPTYVINLPNRTDRHQHILQQFLDKPEFRVQIQTPVSHPVNAVSLWLTLLKIVEKEKEANSSYFIFCEDDHTFTNAYSNELLEQCLTLADKLEVDILSGGVSWFDNAIKTDENLFWIHQFTGMQFTIIYNRFYDRLLRTPYDDRVVTDLQISNMTDKKWLIYPYISTQTEFGYSDVTKKNNDIGFVEELFKTTIGRIEVLNKVTQHLISSYPKKDNSLSDETFSDIAIPTYIINLKERPDRLTHALSQFEGKTEFEIHVVEACKHPVGAVGLWQSIVKIIREIIDGDDDVIIICEDDHTFTPNYNRNEFIHHVVDAAEQNCEILSGGIGGFGNAFPVVENRYWIDWLWCTQFIVIYRPFFKRILDEPFNDSDTADGKISEMASNKMVIYPFISIQNDFGYSDVTRANNEVSGKITEYFQMADKCFKSIDKILKYHNNLLSKR